MSAATNSARALAAETLGFEDGQLSDTTRLNGLTFGVLVRVAVAAERRGMEAERERCARIVCKYCAAQFDAVRREGVPHDFGGDLWHRVINAATYKGSSAHDFAWMKIEDDTWYRYWPCFAAAIRQEATR